MRGFQSHPNETARERLLGRRILNSETALTLKHLIVALPPHSTLPSWRRAPTSNDPSDPEEFRYSLDLNKVESDPVVFEAVQIIKDYLELAEKSLTGKG